MQTVFDVITRTITVTASVWNGPPLPAVVDGRLYFAPHSDVVEMMTSYDHHASNEFLTGGDFQMVCEQQLTRAQEKGVGRNYSCPEYDFDDYVNCLFKAYHEEEFTPAAESVPGFYRIIRVPLENMAAPLRVL